MFDTVIRDSRIIDGTGAPAIHGDLAIRDGRVVSIGRFDGSGAREINAAGRVVCPGFIDVHTHIDAQAFWDTTLSPSPLHGVTSVIAGNCGFSIAPLSAEASGYLRELLARVEGMPLVSLETGVPWDWSSTGEFLDRLDGTLAVNAAFQVGHSAIRRVVMGEAAVEREARDDEIEQMAELLRSSIRQGAVGFSSSWSPTHLDAEGRPVPSRFATSRELLALAGVCGEFDGMSLEFIPNNPDSLMTDEMVNLMTGMSVAARAPVNWNVLIVSEKNRDFAQRKLAVGDEARSRGGRIAGLVQTGQSHLRLNLLSGFILDAIPGWGSTMALPTEEKLRALRDPVERERLRAAAASPAAADYSRYTDWASFRIYETFDSSTADHAGKTVGEVARQLGRDPFDTLLDIACTDGLRTTFGNPPVADTDADWSARLDVWRNRNAVIGGSDAGAHLDMLATYTYTTGMLRDAVREQALLPIEEAVSLLSSVPASLYGLRDRGVLAPGAHADVLVIDDSTVGPTPVETRFDLPGGAPRLYAGAVGVDHVLVNGVEIIVDGEFTETRPGSVLRGGRDTTSDAQKDWRVGHDG